MLSVSGLNLIINLVVFASILIKNNNNMIYHIITFLNILISFIYMNLRNENEVELILKNIL